MASCFNPFALPETGQKVPCGKCTNCIKRKGSGWSFRLMQHDKSQIMTSLFITLTYDTVHVPITPKGYMSLCPRLPNLRGSGTHTHLSAFFKRLRKASPEGSKISYFAVGEYGGKTHRPHYHVLLFGCPPEIIQPAWWYGQVHYGTVTGASVGYCLKYMFKKGLIPAHKNDDRVPERSYTSKGLGLSYIRPSTIRWHTDDLTERMFLPLEDGKKAAMPRYYKDKIYSSSQREAVAKVQSERIIEKMQITYERDGYAATKSQNQIVAKATTTFVKGAIKQNSINQKL